MSAFCADDLAIVIPTRDRWPILQRTLAALRAQTVDGFETIVVVDGRDQSPPPLVASRTIVSEHAGPGSARNAGIAATDRPLVMFLGDDIIPGPRVVAAHLEGHARHPERSSAVLGHIDWHPDVADDRLIRWMEWSEPQFDYHNIAGDDVPWGRFSSSNVSLKREFFLAAGGFDEEFTFDYEDLDLAWRLHEQGMRLWYERGAVAQHLHAYDWNRLIGRYQSRARAERLMEAKHPWFRPHFAAIMQSAATQRPVSRLWPRAVDRIPPAMAPVRDLARRKASLWYHQQLAPPFLAVWEGAPDLDELRAYLGDDFDIELLWRHVTAVDDEERAAPSEADFYRTSRMYLYDLTAFAMTGTKRPYLMDLARFLGPGSRLLDYGCGIGTDGLRLMAQGHAVSFADFANPSTEYLRWRLARRDVDAPVYDLDLDDIPTGFDAAYSLDVIEHVEDPFAFLAELEQRASIVMVNFLEPDPNDTHLHRPLPIRALLDHTAARGILRYRLYHGRSHLVIYRTRRPTVRGRVRNVLQRRLGRRLATSV